jgi:hypothetical protein
MKLISKPPFLFHGSCIQNIDFLRPEKLTFHDPNDEALVYATPSRAYSSCFILSWDDRWATVQFLYGEDIFYFIFRKSVPIEDRDQSGSIYTVASTDFDFHPERSMKHFEWSANIAQKVITEEKYTSGLEAMIQNNIQFIPLEDRLFDAYMQMDMHERDKILIAHIDQKK